MQVTEISAEGLKREYKVVLPAADLASRLESELKDIKDKVRINGFRPGKVPMSHLKRLYGRSVMSEVVQSAVNEANRKIVEDNGLRLALEPKVDLASDQAEVTRAMEARGDLAFTVALETIPAFDPGTFDDLVLERQVVELKAEEVETALDRMADQGRAFTPKTGEDARAERGDRVAIDFEGTIDGEPFEGGKGEDIEVVIGSGSFIPGFEDQLVGAQPGERRRIGAKFPDNFLSAPLAGRDAMFDVLIKTVAAPETVVLDDTFSKSFGFDTPEALRDAVRAKMEADLGRASRDRLKRNLLDALDKKYDFALPEGLVAQEFQNIWRQVLEEQKASKRTFADENSSEAAAREEYRRIAERRVRLGLVLAEVGERGGVKVDDSEVGRALVDITRRYPGQEKRIWDHYRNNPRALSEVKAPLFEEKVVDLIVSQAKVTDRVVPRDELFRMLDEDHDLSPSGARDGGLPEALLESEGAEPPMEAQHP